MQWPPKIERLQNAVRWECKDIPPDLVLAIIKHESGGTIGRPGGVKTKCGNVPTVNGGLKKVCRAYGLMQVIPSTVNYYNSQQSDPNDRATFEDISGKDERAARMQIKLGCFYLAFANHFLNKTYPVDFPAVSLSTAKPDQVKAVLAAYAVGHGAIQKKLNALQEQNRKLTFSNLEKYFPDWGKNKSGEWINRPLHYARVVNKWYQADHTQSPGTTVDPGLMARTKQAAKKGGWLIVPLLGYLAYTRFKDNYE